MSGMILQSDGHSVLVRGELRLIRRGGKYCPCGHEADLVCDWKTIASKSGTCDYPICGKHGQKVGPDKHLCPFHQKAYSQWKRRHPAVAGEAAKQMSLL